MRRPSDPVETPGPPRTVPRPLLRIQPTRGWAALHPGEIWEYRTLLWMFAARDVKLRYKQTALGVVWVFLQPLLPAILFGVIFGHVAHLPSDGAPYVLFALVGLLPWNLVAGSIQRAGTSLVADAGLVTKVYFPRAVLPIASCLAVLVDFAVALICAGAAMAWYRVAPSVRLVFLPGFTLLALVHAVAISLWLSALNVRYRDFAHVVPFAVQAWLFATPIVYSSSMIPARWQALYALNPMVGVVDGFRWSMLGGTEFPARAVAISCGIGIALLFSGAHVFRRVERSLADVI